MPNENATRPPSAAGVRQRLRAATAQVHERLDSCTRRVNLADGRNYGRFLQAQSGPVQALETALQEFGVTRLLPDWSLRSRSAALRHDLQYLNLLPEPCTPVRLKSCAQAFGTLYVLEGSRLGARVLLQQILGAAPALAPATRFLRHGSDQRLWTTFVQILEAKVAIDDWANCAEGARNAFALFERSFMEAFGAPA